MSPAKRKRAKSCGWECENERRLNSQLIAELEIITAGIQRAVLQPALAAKICTETIHHLQIVRKDRSKRAGE
jgi:hypothetical protein